jgi:hypothetical protein
MPLQTALCYGCRQGSVVGGFGRAERDGLDLIEFNTHSFVIKIWLEEPADELHKGRWRGHITHVPSGERRYLQNLKEIVAFIVPYLVSMGVRLEASWRLRSWLRRDHGPRVPGPMPETGEGEAKRVPTPAEGRPGEH